MNPTTGALAPLDGLATRYEPGQIITEEDMRLLAAEHDAARKALEEKQRLVVVSAQVAQRVKLGERELARRQRRR